MKHLALGFALLTTHLFAVGLEVLVVTDVIQDGNFVPPSADHPCPFVFLGGKERSIGAPSANAPMPEWPELQALLIEELAKRHYVATAVGGPQPRLALVCTWGEARLDTDEYEEMNDESGEVETVEIQYNRTLLRRLAGAQDRRTRGQSLAAEDRMNNVLTEDRLYVMIGALDVEALVAGERKLVWRTWISVPDRRNALPEAMAQMIADAGPHFGVESAAPVFIDDKIRRSEVEIGDAIVIEGPPPAP